MAPDVTLPWLATNFELLRGLDKDLHIMKIRPIAKSLGAEVIDAQLVNMDEKTFFSVEKLFRVISSYVLDK